MCSFAAVPLAAPAASNSLPSCSHGWGGVTGFPSGYCNLHRVHLARVLHPVRCDSRQGLPSRLQARFLPWGPVQRGGGNVLGVSTRSRLNVSVPAAGPGWLCRSGYACFLALPRALPSLCDCDGGAFCPTACILGWVLSAVVQELYLAVWADLPNLATRHHFTLVRFCYMGARTDGARGDCMVAV